MAKAQGALLVVTDHELPEEDKEFIREKGIHLWGKDELDYYDCVADAIHQYARYEIVNSFGLHTDEEKDTHRVLALRIKQPTPDSKTELYLFSMSPDRLLKTCAIYRRAQGNALAYQRMLNKNRLPRIRKFVTQANSILPTNIILHLNDKVTVDDVELRELKTTRGDQITLSKSKAYELVTLNIPMEYASLELIDGQHRLYGFVDADPATKKDFNLVALGIRGLDSTRKRDTFVAINDNSRRMDANLVAYLKYTDDDAVCQIDNELMAIRIVVELNKSSPFKNAIRLLDMGKQRITLKGFCGYDLRGLLGKRGLLRLVYPNNSPTEFVAALRLYFGVIRSLFKKEWESSDRYIVATNRGLSAFLKILKSILKTITKHKEGLLTLDILRKYLTPLRRGIATWELDQIKNTYVGSQGWKRFHADLAKVIKKVHPAFIV